MSSPEELCDQTTLFVEQNDSSESLSQFLTTDVPVEIWSKIFSMATHIPGAYDIEDYSAIIAFTRDTHGICVANLFKASMQTKLACSIVCRYWNAVIQPFLFQYLRIESGNQACAIADTLERRIPYSANEGKGPGKWTLRIELALEGEHVWLCTHNEAMFRIFQQCESLICFSEIFSSSGPSLRESDEFIAYLAEHPKLKRLEARCTSRTLSIIEEAFGDLLEALWLISRYTLDNMEKDAYRLSKLRVLVMNHCKFAPTTTITLPELRACNAYAGVSASIHFNTTTIEQLLGYFTHMTLPGSNFWSNLTTLSATIYQLKRFGFILKESFKHSCLKYLIIEDFAQGSHAEALCPWDDDEHIEMCRILMFFISRDVFPNLYSVRLYLPVSYRNTSPSGYPGDDKFWVNWFGSCYRRGIRIEISRGAMEWFEDKWTEIPAYELIDGL